VDADHCQLPPAGPTPTRIVESSPGHYHLFYRLTEAVSPADLQSINRALTHLVGGDRGGHSPAKLFRLPGTFNLKPEYDPPPVVKVIEDTGEEHTPRSMLAQINLAPGDVADIPSSVLSDAEKIDPSVVVARIGRRLSCDTRQRLRQRRVCGPFVVRINGQRYSYRLSRGRDAS
jgi:hypothetical protein